MLCLRKLPVGKKFMDKRGGEYQVFLWKVFCLSAEIFRRESLVCFRNFRVSEHFLRKRGLSRFPKENLLSHSTEKNHRANLLCLTIFLVSKKFMDKNGRGTEGGSITIFGQKIFVSQCQNFVS